MNELSRHLPALLVVLPLLAAPLCFGIRRARWVQIFTLLVGWSCFAISCVLLREVLAHGQIVYRFGGWMRPYGIEYVIDTTNAFVIFVVTLVSALVVVAGMGQARHQVPRGRGYLFYAAALLCLTGLLGVTITGDVFNVFVFLEISSLSSYLLIALGQTRRAMMSAFSYLIMGTIGATFLLIGIGLMYQMTGTLNMADMAERLKAVSETRTVLVAVAFVIVGLSTKLAVFPLHQWLPNAYTWAPPVVSAFLAGTATKVAFYLLVRFCISLFGVALVFDAVGVQVILAPLSVAAMIVGSTAAIYQTRLRRVLAYSSIAQIGYMTLGLSLASVTGLTGALVHLFNHALMKGGLFLVAACVIFRVGTTTFDQMRGLGRRMPLTMAAFVTGGLAMIGLPGTAGFVSKWYLVSAALEQGAYTVAIAIVVTSLLAVVYVWRVVEVAYFSPSPPDAPRGDAPLHMLIPTWILIGASVYFGLFTELSVGVASTAAHQLMGVAP
jgi:multicomponent Na+:H+ antiporter subunit D